MEENQSKFTKILYNQVALVTAIIGIVWGAYNYINLPTVQFKLEIQQLQNDIRNSEKAITNLKDNDLHEIQLTLKRIEDKQKRFTDMQYKLGLQHHVNQVAVRLASNSEEKTVMTAVIQGMLYRMEKDGIIKIL